MGGGLKLLLWPPRALWRPLCAVWEQNHTDQGFTRDLTRRWAEGQANLIQPFRAFRRARDSGEVSREDHSTHGIEASQENDHKEDKGDSDKDDNDDNEYNGNT